MGLMMVHNIVNVDWFTMFSDGVHDGSQCGSGWFMIWFMTVDDA